MRERANADCLKKGFVGKFMFTRTSLIVIGLLTAFILIALNADFLFGVGFGFLSSDFDLPFNDRAAVLIIGVGLIGLRLFLTYRNQSDNDES